MITPASDGPTSRAALNIDEFSAIALPRSSLFSIIVIRNAWRPGMSNAFTSPWTTLSPMIERDRDPPRQGQRGQREGLQHRHGLRRDEQPVAVPPIDVDAGERADEERGELPREADDAEEEGRSGQAIDEPARRRRGDPRAGQRDDLSAEEQPVVPIAERPQHEPQAAGAAARRLLPAHGSGNRLDALRPHLSLHQVGVERRQIRLQHPIQIVNRPGRVVERPVELARLVGGRQTRIPFNRPRQAAGRAELAIHVGLNRARGVSRAPSIALGLRLRGRPRRAPRRRCAPLRAPGRATAADRTDSAARSAACADRRR